MNRKAAVFLRQAALAMFIAALVVLAVCAVALTAEIELSNNVFSQHITVAREGMISGAALSLCVLAAVLAVHGWMERFGGIKLSAGLCALWLASACFWIMVMQILQRADARTVMEAAKQFAADN